MPYVKNDFLAGLALAFGVEGAVAKKTPTAYSYNGVVLPALPEWDREGYPYALLCKDNTSTTDDTLLILADCEMVYCQYFGSYIAFPYDVSYSDDVTFHYHEYILQDNKFVFERTVTNRDPNGPGIFSGDFIWTNHNIREELDDYTLGEVVYSASEPVPVYE